MKSYRVITSDSKVIRKDMKALQKSGEFVNVLHVIEAFAQDPLSPSHNVKILSPKSKGLFRLRIGKLRVLYSLDVGNQIMIVHRVAKRSEVYR